MPYTRADNIRPYEVSAKVPEGGMGCRECRGCGGRADGDIGPYEGYRECRGRRRAPKGRPYEVLAVDGRTTLHGKD